jgi:YggT family protein
VALLRLLVLAYILAIVLVIVLSWFPLAGDGPAERAFVFLRRITDPVLAPVRRLVPPVGGVLDLSPTIVLFVLFALLQVLS